MARVQNAIFDRELSSIATALGLPRFETRPDCEKRQASMLQCFRKLDLQPSSWSRLSGCNAQHCAMDICVEACHFGTLHRRVAALRTGLPIIAAHSGPLWAVTIVHPLWETPSGQLIRTPMAAAMQWNARHLRSLAIPGLLAVGIYEVSLNRDHDDEVYWAGEIQQIVAGATKEQLRSAFEVDPRHRRLRPGQKIVDVREFSDLSRKFAYAQKRFVEERRAYISETTGRQNRNHLPPAPVRWTEHDVWLLSLPLGARTIAFGCVRRGLKFYARS
jgi:hypothetical protein